MPGVPYAARKAAAASAVPPMTFVDPHICYGLPYIPLRSTAAMTAGMATHGIAPIDTDFAVYLATDGILCVR